MTFVNDKGERAGEAAAGLGYDGDKEVTAMFCKNCGNKIPDGAGFCSFCSAAVPGERADRGPKASVRAGGEDKEMTGTHVTENVILCPDGVYRWVYEFPMLKNPTILFTIWKALGLSFGIVYVFMLLLELFSGSGSSGEGFLRLTLAFAGLMLLFLVIGIIAYLIIAAMNGWKYMVLFEMDENCVKHIQMEKQFQKTQALGWLSAAAGLVSGNFSAAGAGILAATRDTSISVFTEVRTVRGSRRAQVIYVNQRLARNQVYAEAPDYDFVYRFIAGHCVNAKSIR